MITALIAQTASSDNCIPSPMFIWDKDCVVDKTIKDKVRSFDAKIVGDVTVVDDAIYINGGYIESSTNIPELKSLILEYELENTSGFICDKRNKAGGTGPFTIFVGNSYQSGELVLRNSSQDSSSTSALYYNRTRKFRSTETLTEFRQVQTRTVASMTTIEQDYDNKLVIGAQVLEHGYRNKMKLYRAIGFDKTLNEVQLNRILDLYTRV